MARKIFSLLWCSLLISCSSKDESSLAYLFPKHIDLQSQLCKIQSDDILSPLSLISAGDYLICANFRTEKCIRIYDLETGRVVNDIVNLGRGPGELLNVSSVGYLNDLLTVYSNNTRRVLTIHYGELQNTNPEMTVIDSIEQCSRLLSVAYDQYILAGCADGKYLKLVDGRGSYLSSFDTYPDNGEHNHPEDNRLIYQGKLAASPDGKHFVFAASSGISFKFGKVRGKGSVSKTKEYIIALPEYILDSAPANNRHSIVWKEAGLRGTLSMAAGSKYCFFLQDESKYYADRNWKMSTVLVFDWQGKPIVKLHLDKPLESISYNERENILIGLTSNEQNQPQFVAYRLPALS